MTKHEQFMFDHLKQLIGKKVTSVVPESSGQEPIWGLEFDGGSAAFILCDPEGNGPGFLNIEPKE